MVELYSEPSRIPVPGNKIINEYIGVVSTGESRLSVARMMAPSGWSEPFQTPEFDEFTIVLSGAVTVDYDDGKSITAHCGESVKVVAGERIRYSTGEDGAEYIAVCLPAFTPETVHRDE
ncbi:cupin domain-containing protein [Flexivirga oryzae]|uniref:Quercetin dioxygenase-like cupin family protein n=1 Tax=Flexivirga oryzae TaxID=1794944 RepID=A0A839NA65_9MICO|nr:cupin [Flexivirga oryzae]MBB2892536.1 quercetin dioxygenase-like cupin family protein [Flexivirga oryzae]